MNWFGDKLKAEKSRFTGESGQSENPCPSQKIKYNIKLKIKAQHPKSRHQNNIAQEKGKQKM